MTQNCIHEKSTASSPIEFCVKSQRVQWAKKRRAFREKGMPVKMVASVLPSRLERQVVCGAFASLCLKGGCRCLGCERAGGLLGCSDRGHAGSFCYGSSCRRRLYLPGTDGVEPASLVFVGPYIFCTLLRMELHDPVAEIINIFSVAAVAVRSVCHDSKLHTDRLNHLAVHGKHGLMFFSDGIRIS